MVNQIVEHNIQRMNIQEEKEEQKIWVYENPFDYHYGRNVGMLIRLLREEFKKQHDRDANPKEVVEIMYILSQNTWKIRQALAIFKNK